MSFDEWFENLDRLFFDKHANAGTEYLNKHRAAIKVIAESAWNESRKQLKGMSVSIDVSTCDEDSGNRAHGVITGELEGGILLAEGEVNFSYALIPLPQPPKEQGNE